MRATAAQIRADENYEYLSDDEILALFKDHIMRHKKTGNHVYLIGKRAFDRFMRVTDSGGVIFCDYRRSGFLKKIRNAAEAAAGLLIHGTAPKTRIVLRALGLNTEFIDKAVEKVQGAINKESVNTLITELGPDNLVVVHKAFQDAMSDGVFTTEEWKEIQALARTASD